VLANSLPVGRVLVSRGSVPHKRRDEIGRPNGGKNHRLDHVARRLKRAVVDPDAKRGGGRVMPQEKAPRSCQMGEEKRHFVGKLARGRPEGGSPFLALGGDRKARARVWKPHGKGRPTRKSCAEGREPRAPGIERLRRSPP